MAPPMLELELDTETASTTDESDRLFAVVNDRRAVASDTYAPDQIHDALARVAGLKQDWDSYGAPRMDPVVVARSKVVIEAIYSEAARACVALPPPVVSPGGDGSVAFHWRVPAGGDDQGDLEIVITEDAVEFVAAKRGRVDDGTVANRAHALELLRDRILRH